MGNIPLEFPDQLEYRLLRWRGRYRSISFQSPDSCLQSVYFPSKVCPDLLMMLKAVSRQVNPFISVVESGMTTPEFPVFLKAQETGDPSVSLSSASIATLLR
jgi:hypothetical protein